MAANLRNIKLFKERLAQLEEETNRLGVVFAPAEAADLLAERVAAIAAQLGVTERTALQSYTTPHNISLLAKVLGEHAATYRQVMAEAEPVTITVPDAGRVLAALGMVCKLATEEIEKDPADAAGLLTDAADAIVGIGAEIRTSNRDEPVTISEERWCTRVRCSRAPSGDSRLESGSARAGRRTGPARVPALWCKGSRPTSTSSVAGWPRPTNGPATNGRPLNGDASRRRGLLRSRFDGHGEPRWRLRSDRLG